MKFPFCGRLVMCFVFFLYFSVAPIPINAEQYRIISVQDDATIKAEGNGTEITVRLAGIETPGSSTMACKLVSHLLNRLMNSRVVLQLHAPAPSPIPAEIFLNKENINLEVIREGLAKAHRNGDLPNLDHDAFVKAETMAKTERKGMWSPPIRNKKMGLIPALLLLGICGTKTVP